MAFIVVYLGLNSCVLESINTGPMTSNPTNVSETKTKGK